MSSDEELKDVDSNEELEDVVVSDQDLKKTVSCEILKKMASDEDLKKMGYEQLGIGEGLIRGCKSLGWDTLSKVQKKILVKTLKSKPSNSIACIAKPNSGRLSGCALSILSKPVHPFCTIVVSNSSKNALSIYNLFNNLGCYIHVKCSLIDDAIGNVVHATRDNEHHVLSLRDRPHVIVGTPATISRHLIAKDILWDNIGSLTHFVIDSADKLSIDAEDDIEVIMSEIPQSSSVYMLSAITNAQYLRDFKIMFDRQFTKITDTSTEIDILCNQYIIIEEEDDEEYIVTPAYHSHGAVKKKICLSYLLGNLPNKKEIRKKSVELRTVVFTSTAEVARELGEMLASMEVSGIYLNGFMSQEDIAEGGNAFMDRKDDLLLCDDHVADSIDIPTVDLLINYDFPISEVRLYNNQFIRRFIKIARVGKPGRAISLVKANERLSLQQKLMELMPGTPAVEIFKLVLNRADLSKHKENWVKKLVINEV